ncbi:MAG: aldehyde dehydrogenase [Bacteroidia bacterium]|nr:aldehyde dehydrogenase [Bacteroidia bacterium]MDW8159482.1 aldehyde dehydrogenase [Bacteroidia bacterium]
MSSIALNSSVFTKEDIQRRIEELFKAQKEFFETGSTRSLSFRAEQLRALKAKIKSSESKIMEALAADLRKPSFESYATEIGFILEEVKHTLSHLQQWAMPQTVVTPITQFLSKSQITYEPLGRVVIIAPWNYPFQLLIGPMVGAIAAGNCCILKPSEYAPHTAAIVQEIISQLYPSSFVAVIQGGVEETQLILAQKSEYIFFTGSTKVGKIVMRAAAEHLTPVTLELGGKSPCLVEQSANLPIAAARIAWGKFLNNGQTCVAPDYVLVDEKIQDKLVQALKKVINKMYGPDPRKSPDYGRIINLNHFRRLQNYLNQGKVVLGGQTDESDLYIAPTIMTDIDLSSPIAEEEIFGPILPIIAYQTLEEAIAFIKSKPQPLAFYLFTQNRETEKMVLSRVQFGGGCVNDTIVHLAVPDLPFGGIGASGLGAYHGKYSFETFSHKRALLKKSNFPDIPIRYAPYKNKLNLLKKLLG